MAWTWHATAAQAALDQSDYMASLDGVTAQTEDARQFAWRLDDYAVGWSEATGWVDDIDTTLDATIDGWLEPENVRGIMLNCTSTHAGVGVAASESGIAYVTVIAFTP